MKVNREQLLNQIQSVQPGIAVREIHEQSSCVVFTKKHMMTYNDEIACTQKSCLDIEGAVQAAPLLALLRMLKEEILDIDIVKGELLIKGKRKRSGIRIEQEILLPIDAVDKPKGWQDLHEDFAEAVGIVQQCTSKDDSQFNMTCVHITPKHVEACDNFQAARYSIKTGVEESTLVRQDSLRHIITLDMTEFCETKNWIHFRNPTGLVISCRRFLEDYPDIGPHLKMKEVTPTALPKGLKEAAQLAEVFSSEDVETDRVSILLQPGKLKITGKGVSGWYSEVKPIKYKGPDLPFLISPKLLIELVQKHNECQIAKNRLKVSTGKFEYVTVLGAETE